MGWILERVQGWILERIVAAFNNQFSSKYLSEADSTPNKIEITLYDDCEKLLGSRTMKIGDNVSPGETIAFDSYLVDIGEDVGGCALVTSLNEDCVQILKEISQQKNRKITETVGLGHVNRFRHNLLPSEDTKPALRKNISLSELSPSQRIVRDRNLKTTAFLLDDLYICRRRNINLSSTKYTFV